MGFNAGVFTRLYSWVTDKNNSVAITASRMDADTNDIASGLSNTICRDGQSTITAAIPFNNQKITGLGDATADQDAVNRRTGDGRFVTQVGGKAITAASSVSASTIDLTTGRYFYKTASGALSWTFSNPVATGSLDGFILELTNGGTGAQTWPAAVSWPNATAPTLTTSGTDILVFITRDGGTTWRGKLASRNT